MGASGLGWRKLIVTEIFNTKLDGTIFEIYGYRIVWFSFLFSVISKKSCKELSVQTLLHGLISRTFDNALFLVLKNKSVMLNLLPIFRLSNEIKNITWPSDGTEKDWLHKKNVCHSTWNHFSILRKIWERGNGMKNPTRDPYFLSLQTGFHGSHSQETCHQHIVWQSGLLLLLIEFIFGFCWHHVWDSLGKVNIHMYSLHLTCYRYSQDFLECHFFISVEKQLKKNCLLKWLVGVCLLFSKSKLAILPLSLKKCCWLAVCYF